MFKAKVVLDSIGPNDIRLISVEATYPRFIHAEIMTHRDRNRNAASSRAIPWKRKGKGTKSLETRKPGEILLSPAGELSQFIFDEKQQYEYLVANCMYSMVRTDPVIPMFLGSEQKGMQSGDEISGKAREEAIDIIRDMRDYCLQGCDKLANLGLHKSIVNRYVEPWMWITVLMTSTNWKNFFRLRHHPAAEKHFQHIAAMIKEQIDASKPRPLRDGEWHLPYVTKMDDPLEYWCGKEGIEIMGAVSDKKFEIPDYVYNNTETVYQAAVDIVKRISAGRSARLSYLTHDGVRDWNDDLKLCKQLIERTDDVLHATPLENVARASTDPNLRSGPFRGWFQFRKEFPNEFIEG